MFARVTSSEIPSFKVKIISSQYMEWNNLGITTLKMFPKCFLKIAREPNNYQFYLPKFLKFCENILHKLLGPSQCLEKLMEILE